MKITTCAIRMSNGCIVSMERPARHHHILKVNGELLADGEQGFLTSAGCFVDRVKARTIADNAAQIVYKCINDDERLFSENLWNTEQTEYTERERITQEKVAQLYADMCQSNYLRDCPVAQLKSYQGVCPLKKCSCSNATLQVWMDFFQHGNEESAS